jgi:MarR family transcriptional regulator, organic hydroperoxide resistance regulator
MPAEQAGRDGGLGYLLIQAAQAWRNLVAAGLRDTGVTPSQFFVLVTLLRRTRRDGTGMTQREAADRIRMDANTMSQIVRGLERRGLLTRSPHPDDTRAVILALTTPGRELTSDCAARVRAISADFFAGVDQSVLGDALTMLLDQAGPR